MTNTMCGRTVTERVVGVMSRFEPIMGSIIYYLVWVPAGCPALELETGELLMKDAYVFLARDMDPK
jgi:hypothetical protein